MNRREFIFATAAAMSAVALAREVPGDVKIVRIVGFDLPTKRVKFVGKNSRLDVHGDKSRDRIVRLIASDGTEGFGCSRADEKKLAPWLGKGARELVGSFDAPALDLIGKLQGEPVCELLAPKTAKRQAIAVRVYDGSVYFSDLLPEYADNWRDRFKEEVDDILKRGHRAMKVKIGRGAKWMERDAGDARDIEVLKLLRQHAGKDVGIAVDANNGYDLQRTKKLFDALPDFNFEFVEEMFPEEIEADLALKQAIRERGLKTLIADGETQNSLDPLKPLMAAKAIDLFQLDVNAVGIDGLMNEAAACEATGGMIAPHAWGTLCGFFAQLHVGRAIPNFFSGEQDPLSSPALIADGYEIKDGKCSVPDAPGFGLKLDLSKLPADTKLAFDLKV